MQALACMILSPPAFSVSGKENEALARMDGYYFSVSQPASRAYEYFLYINKSIFVLEHAVSKNMKPRITRFK